MGTFEINKTSSALSAPLPRPLPRRRSLPWVALVILLWEVKPTFSPREGGEGSRKNRGERRRKIGEGVASRRRRTGGKGKAKTATGNSTGVSEGFLPPHPPPAEGEDLRPTRKSRPDLSLRAADDSSPIIRNLFAASPSVALVCEFRAIEWTGCCDKFNSDLGISDEPPQALFATGDSQIREKTQIRGM